MDWFLIGMAAGGVVSGLVVVWLLNKVVALNNEEGE